MSRIRPLPEVVASLALAGLAWMGQAAAQEPVSIENDEIPQVIARDPGGHWTPQALSDAQLQPLPQPTMPLDTLIEQAGAEPSVEAAGIEVVVNGANPAVDDIAPDLGDRLFPAKPIPESLEVVPEDVGQSGAYFSSSRLVPIDARLHYPYRANGKVFFEKPGGGNFICSGAVIRPRLVLTAGHCVHQGSGGTGGFYRRFLFVPAYHEGQAPYQAWNWRWVITTGPWATSNGSVPNEADFAIIEVEDRRFGNETKKIGEVVGWLGYRTNALDPNHTKKIGYPGNHDGGEIMHQVDSESFEAADADTVLYGSDMRGGSSGGAWIENFGVQAAGQQGGLEPWPNRVVGVTSYGYVATDPKVQGSSILNQDFLSILNTACAHRQGNC